MTFRILGTPEEVKRRLDQIRALFEKVAVRPVYRDGKQTGVTAEVWFG